MVKIILFFCFLLPYVQATVFPEEQDIFYFNRDEVRHPYNWTIPVPFKAEVVHQAKELLKHIQEEVIQHKKAEQLFYQLNSETIARILNERQFLLNKNTDWTNIPVSELDYLYENKNVQDIIDFIVINNLSSKQIFVFLWPFLRDFLQDQKGLSGSDLITILNTVSFDVNTVLKPKDMLSLFLEPSLIKIEESLLEHPSIKSEKSPFVPDARGIVSALKQAQSFLFSEGGESSLPATKEQEGNLKHISQEQAKELSKGKSKEASNEGWQGEPNNYFNPGIFTGIDHLIKEGSQGEFTHYFNPEIVITSLAHLATTYKKEELVKFLYTNKDFNPNLVNHIGQTPLHSLFKNPTIKPAKKMGKKEWERMLSFIFDNPQIDKNAKDIQGLSPLALAILQDQVVALPLLFDVPDIDLSIKDHYNRSLVILAVQSLSKKDKKHVISTLIQKGGEQLLTPSYFNDYMDEKLNPITIHYLHPLRDVIFQAFSIIKEQQRERSNQAIASLSEYDYKLKQSLKVRNSFYQNLSQLKGAYYQQPVIQAIKKDDRDFFEKWFSDSSDIQNFVQHIFPIPVLIKKRFLSEQVAYIPSYHLLLLAITENSPQVVQFFVESIKNPYVFQPEKNSESLYMDILSEALIQSFRISVENLSSQTEFELENSKSLKIISALMSSKKIDSTFKNFMDLSPMEIAFLTGQTEKVKSLEKQNIALPVGDLWDTGVLYLDIVERQGFKKISDYIRSKQNIQQSSCYNQFIN